MITTLAAMPEPLFSYSFEIAGREFLIAVNSDGIIHWDDYQTRRRVRSQADRNLEVKAMFGDARARHRLAAEIDEFTVSIRLTPEMLARFREAARLLADDRWAPADEEELDRFLIPLFWSDVNPHLHDPLERPIKTD